MTFFRSGARGGVTKLNTPMNAQKIGSSLLITALTCLAPLAGRPALMIHPLTLAFVGPAQQRFQRVQRRRTPHPPARSR